MGVLLVFAAPGQILLLAGLEHGRTIPLRDVVPFSFPPRPPHHASDVPVDRFPREGHEPFAPRPGASPAVRIAEQQPAAVSTAGPVPLPVSLGPARLTPPQPPRHRRWYRG